MHCDTCEADDHTTKGHARRDRKAQAALPKPAPLPIKRKRSRRYPEDAMYRWAQAYDSLNGAPENDGDR